MHAENNYPHWVQMQQYFILHFLKKVVNFHSISIVFFLMAKEIKWSTLFKIGSSHLHLLYCLRVYMVVTDSQTLRPSLCLNENWVIKSGSSAQVILHLPVILLLSFDGKLMIKGLKTLQGKTSELRFTWHIYLIFFFNLLPLFKST